MSMLMNLAEASTQLFSDPTMISASGTGGILDWVDNKTSQATVTIRTFSVLLAIIFVIVAAVMSRMSMARVLIAGITAGLFVWIVFNVTSLRDRVDNEINASGAVASSTVSGAVAGADGGPLADVTGHRS